MNLLDPIPDLSWQGTGLTEQGLVRSTNQDSFAVENQIGLWVVADGMGGHSGGGVASQLAVQALVAYIRASTTSQADFTNRLARASDLLTSAIAAGDSTIRGSAAETPDLAGMGTTIVAGLFCPGPIPSLAVAHIGDSRAYLVRQRCIRALTTDHSFVQGLLTQGRITSHEARQHPKQNILLRAMGVEDHASPDIAIHPLEPDDILLFCTDGLTKMVSEDDILTCILNRLVSPSETCRQLIQMANDRGGKDNSTVVIVSSSSRGT
jgi:protein phosphatase